MCVKCLEGIVYGMSWLDDLWYSTVNFDSHISNVVGYCMCGVAGVGETLICGAQGQEKH